MVEMEGDMEVVDAEFECSVRCRPKTSVAVSAAVEVEF